MKRMFVLLSAFLVAGFVQAPRDGVAAKNSPLLRATNVVEHKISEKNKALLAAANVADRSSAPSVNRQRYHAAIGADIDVSSAGGRGRERERGRGRGLHGVRFSPIRSRSALSSRSRH